MTTLPTRLTLTGFISGSPEITDLGSGVSVRFTLVYSPTGEALDDAVLPCVLHESNCSVADAESYLHDEAPVTVTGCLRLPQHAGDRLSLEVYDVQTDEDEDHDTTAPLRPETPVSISTVDGHTVVLTEQPDGEQQWHVITLTGLSATSYTEDQIPLAVEWLSRLTQR
ncbi:hypothetical protein ABIA33_004873 [Streptacidiphilus sp. MAP12-16]|uniref:hypothetical protein n=1 Tax=Streptacidiphilus sp. MAP12-16 TaxID=3156300 RepID=UPI003513BC5F